MRLLAATSPPALHVSRPTRSTVSFTATTRPPARTLTARALLHLSHGVRAAIGLLILALFWAKWRVLFPLEDEGREQEEMDMEQGIQRRVLLSGVGKALVWCAERCDWRGLVVGGVGGLWGVLRRGYTEESLLVLRGLGIQTSSSSLTYLSTATTRFIPTASIQGIFIHEAFKGFEVRFYLAIVVEGEEDAVVVFPKLLPRRHILEEVWRGARACLYEPKG